MQSWWFLQMMFSAIRMLSETQEVKNLAVSRSGRGQGRHSLSTAHTAGGWHEWGISSSTVFKQSVSVVIEPHLYSYTILQSIGDLGPLTLTIEIRGWEHIWAQSRRHLCHLSLSHTDLTSPELLTVLFAAYRLYFLSFYFIFTSTHIIVYNMSKLLKVHIW